MSPVIVVDLAVGWTSKRRSRPCTSGARPDGGVPASMIVFSEPGAGDRDGVGDVEVAVVGVDEELGDAGRW